MDEVRVEVLVTNKRMPVGGLTADDFEIKDNGKVQQTRLVTDPLPVRAVVVLDTSGSVVRSKDDLRGAVGAFTGALRPDDSAAIITFSQEVVLDIPPSRGRPPTDRVFKAMDRIQPTGRTAMRDALFAGLMLAEVDGVRPLVVLFGDGTDNASWLTEQAVLDAAKRSNAVLHAIIAGEAVKPALNGVPEGRPFPFLSAVADATGGDLVAVPSAQLHNEFAFMLQEFRSRYVLAYTPDAAQRDGRWHTLKASLRKKVGDVRARSGYYAGSR